MDRLGKINPNMCTLELSMQFRVIAMHTYPVLRKQAFQCVCWLLLQRVNLGYTNLVFWYTPSISSELWCSNLAPKWLQGASLFSNQRLYFVRQNFDSTELSLLSSSLVHVREKVLVYGLSMWALINKLRVIGKQIRRRLVRKGFISLPKCQSKPFFYWFANNAKRQYVFYISVKKVIDWQDLSQERHTCSTSIA